MKVNIGITGKIIIAGLSAYGIYYGISHLKSKGILKSKVSDSTRVLNLDSTKIDSFKVDTVKFSPSKSETILKSEKKKTIHLNEVKQSVKKDSKKEIKAKVSTKEKQPDGTQGALELN